MGHSIYIYNVNYNGHSIFSFAKSVNLPFTKTKLYQLFINLGEEREDQIHCVFPQTQILKYWYWKRKTGQIG